MNIPPCPENWESCLTCGAAPNETCRDPDVTKGKRMAKAFFIEPSTLLGTDRAVPASNGEGGEDRKETNPKEAVGIRKVPMSTVSAPVLAEVGVAMLEGARKYGRHNYRTSGVRGSVYYDATMRHLMQWWEGEDTDPDSGLSHVTKAITSLIVLRDSMIQGTFVDDRPPQSPSGWLRDLQGAVDALFEKYPEAAKAFTQVSET